MHSKKKITKLSMLDWLSSQVWIFKNIFLLSAFTKYTKIVYIFLIGKKTGEFKEISRIWFLVALTWTVSILIFSLPLNQFGFYPKGLSLWWFCLALCFMSFCSPQASLHVAFPELAGPLSKVCMPKSRPVQGTFWPLICPGGWVI